MCIYQDIIDENAFKIAIQKQDENILLDLIDKSIFKETRKNNKPQNTNLYTEQTENINLKIIKCYGKEVIPFRITWIIRT